MAVRQDASTGQLIDDGQALDKADGEELLRVKVYSPFRTYFNAPAHSVSAVNLTGPFDILPRHHKFVSLLEPCEMALETPGGPQKIKIAGGLMRVHDNEVSVLLDI